MTEAVGPQRLIGDIGATNARFARLDAAGSIVRTRVFACDDFLTVEAAIAAYLAEEPTLPRPEEAALAVASPVTGDAVTLTNHPWSFSIAALRERLGLTRLLVVNDFAATALAVQRLKPEERSAIGGGAPAADQPIGVIGPGTGLGVSALVPTPSGWIALSGEGGHATMPPADRRESEVLEHMRRRFDHVSAERVLSGPGLVNLYNTLAEIDDVPAAPFTPAQIADRRIGESDPLAREALALFCAMLGTVAGDLALTLGARGGVYIAGGIVPRLGASFAASRFRERFEAKGRFSTYLSAIPTYVITHPIPALLGLAALLDLPT
ncbi:MAG TPA: glucokinase [Stellaceae bacterium]|nr:glucokinase [Stellaceae bacterium]